MRVLAAMSGGVDSAVAAARARDAGHDVVGVHLALSAKPATMREGARGCCSVEDSHDARRCADVLDIPFYVWDMAARFTEDVDRAVRRRVRGRADAEPVPAVQREDQVLGGAGPGARAGLRRRRHRALRAPRRRRPAPGRRRGQGPVLRPRRADRPASSRTRCSRSATRRSREVRAEAAAPRARRRREARQPRHLLHPLRRHPRVPGRPPRGRAGRAGRRRVRGGRWGGTRGSRTSPSGSATASVCSVRPPTAARATCWASSRCRDRSRWARPRSSTCGRCARRRRCGTARRG